MAESDNIRIMISSRCNVKISFQGKHVPRSDVRRALKNDLEEEQLLGGRIFDVWINEEHPSDDAAADAWELCMSQVRKADIVLALYDGHCGWSKVPGEVGICHGELQTAYETAPAKLHIVRIDPEIALRSGKDGESDQKFRDYVNALNRFTPPVRTGEEVIDMCKRTLREAVAKMVHLGVREARKGKFYTGQALEWSRLDLAERRTEMETTLRFALLSRPRSEETGEHAVVTIAGKRVLVRCHAIPAAFSVAAAREMVGQPFLRDHECTQFLHGPVLGPVHFIACNRSITEAQAMKQLGFPDATFVSPPFGVYVADNIQKIQIVFVANCRDETSTRVGVQRAFEWFEQTDEGSLLAQRAAARKRIVETIASECETASSRRQQLAKASGGSKSA